MTFKISQLAAAASIIGTELIEVSKLSTTVTKTAGTISAQASDNSINDSGSGWIAAGFAVGDQVRIQGFTGNVVNNIFSARITALTAPKMIFGGTDGDVIVDDAAGESVTVTKWESRRVTASDLAGVAPTTPVLIQIAVSDEATALTAGTSKVTFRAPYAFTLTGVRASVSTAPTGATLLTVDVNESGVSVLSTKLTFDASEKTTVTAATPAVISDSAIADDAEISIDIDSVGSTVPGAGLKVTLIGTKP